jgi:hypothetical protein
MGNPAPGLTRGLCFGLARPWKARLRLKAGALLALAVNAGPAAADYSCTYDRRCFESDGCTSATYENTVRVADRRMSDEDNDVPMIAMSLDGIHKLFVAGHGDLGAVYFLTVDLFDLAILTVHVPEANNAVSFFGKCEDL